MVIDASVIVAIMLDEPDAASFERRIADDAVRRMSAATLLEAAMVVEARLGERGGILLDLWLHRTRVEILAVDFDQAEEARRAWRRFGKGHHPVGLNYSDCFAYALARAKGEALLFKGDDFARTDIAVA